MKKYPLSSDSLNITIGIYLGFYLLSVLNFFSLLWRMVWTLNLSSKYQKCSFHNQAESIGKNLPKCKRLLPPTDFAKIQFRKHSFSWRSRFQLETFLEMNSCRNSVLLFSSVISIISMSTFGKCGYFEFRHPVVFFIFLCWYLFILDSKSRPIPHSCLVFLHLRTDSLF